MSDNKNDTKSDAKSDAKAPKKARVLVATVIGGVECKPNDVVTLDDAGLATHAGQVDATPAAVKYAESLK